MLVSIRDVTPEPLLWEQPGWPRREYELRAGRDVVATLSWPGFFGWTALGETAEGRFRIRVSSFWRGRIAVHPGDSDSELAVYQPRWLGGGMVRFSGGRTFRIRRGDFWHRRWIVEDEAGAAVFILHSRWHFLRERAAVELMPGAERTPELSPLLLLAWHARLRMHRRHSG